MTRYSGPADPSTLCDECGGPTYTFSSGSIWCPAEDPHPGGRFVKRVAFERAPIDGHEAATRARSVSRATPKPKVIAAEPGFDMGMDGFVRSK